MRQTLDGVEVDVWSGVAESTSASTPFALATVVGFLPDGVTPVLVNVSHPLWVQTSAKIDHFSTNVSDSDFGIPDGCPIPKDLALSSKLLR